MSEVTHSPNPDVLLNAFKAQLHAQLVNQLMPVAKEVVERAALDATAALEKSIEVAYHDMTQKLVVQLSINDKEVPREPAR